MRFNSTGLPSTHIPGTMSGNMSPQMLPDAQVGNQNMKATITTNKANSTSKSSYSPYSQSDRNSGKRTGGKSSIKRDNRYTSVNPRQRGNVNINVDSSSSNSLDTGRFGYNTKDSSPIKITSSKMSLFTNPVLPGEFDPIFTDVNLTKLAVNVVDIDLIGYTRVSDSKLSIAAENFKLMYYKMVSVLANNPSKAYQIQFQNISTIKTYFNGLFVLLKRYYEMESILAWNPPPSEYNVTLDSMRKIFDNTTILFLKIDVVEMIQKYYLPDEFVSLANYFTQTFKTGNVSDSKLFKFTSKELAACFRDNSTTAYVTKVREEMGNLEATSDSPTTGKLTGYTVAQISGFLEKDFNFGRKYSSGLPGAANHAIHDLDAYDIFINQSTRYSNTIGNVTTDFRFPDLPASSNTPYASHKEGNDISTFQLAFQGVSSSADSILKTGFMVEDTIEIPLIGQVPQDRRVNKLWLAVNPDGTIKVYTRSTVRTNIFNDFNFVDLQSNFPFTKVSITPSHAQLLYMNGDPVKDVATRSFSNKLFGNLK